MIHLALIMLSLTCQAKADGNLSSGMLSDIGLAGMKTMSDVEGQKIRGKGYALAYGYGFAAYRSSYYSYGQNGAKGRNVTRGRSLPHFRGAGVRPGHFRGSRVFSSGSSSAYAR